MFSQFKDRMAEKLRNLGPQDDMDKLITGIVDQGSDPRLTGPNWGINMQLVDVVNSSPEIACEKLLRIVNRTVAKPTVRSQVLALTMLDTCVRNCHPLLHAQLASSLLWADLLKLVQDTSVTRVDLEVRDKILSMVEDYGKYIKQPAAFAQTYEQFVDQGVDFPVRSPDDVVPFEPIALPEPVVAPVPQPPPQPAAGGGAPRMFSNFLSNLGAGPAPGAVHGPTGTPAPPPAPAPPQQQRQTRSGGGVSPAVLEGMSEEDRAAVQAAMAEMAAEAEAAQQAAAVEASLREGPPRQGAAPGTAPSPAARLPADDAEALAIIASNVTLFSEMLAGVTEAGGEDGVRDPLITDLADTCSQYKTRLNNIAAESKDDQVLERALTVNDTLGSTLARYDDLTARVLARNGHTPASDTAARAVAATTAITSPTARAAAGGQFTLAEEDEEEEEEGESLQTRRRQGFGATAVPTSPPPSRPAPGPDVLDLLSGPDAPPATDTARKAGSPAGHHLP